jgi:hypothetical protein
MKGKKTYTVHAIWKEPPCQHVADTDEDDLFSLPAIGNSYLPATATANAIFLRFGRRQLQVQA